MHLIHYGLQRSGTNYTEELLTRTYQVKWRNIGSPPRNHPSHKHFRPYGGDTIPTDHYRTENPPNTLQDLESRLEAPLPTYYVIISKSPYSWLLSYQKWADINDWPTPDYHYIEEYNRFYRAWLKWAETSERIVFVRYIDILRSPEAQLERLGQRMGLTRRWTALLKSTVPMEVEMSPEFDEDRRRYYLEHEYLDEYTSEEWGILHSHLDVNVAEELGYKVDPKRTSKKMEEK